MQRVPLSARVLVDLDSSARAKAAAEGVSLSAIVERALADYLQADAEQPDKPAWAIALEQRVSQLESQPNDTATAQLSRKAKRRR